MVENYRSSYHSLFLGGGLVQPEDERVLALVPEAAAFEKGVAKQFTAEFWNPTDVPIEARLFVTAAMKRRATVSFSGALCGKATSQDLFTEKLTVPSREVVKVKFEVKA